MAFDHENFAVNGLYPGMVTTRSIANIGHLKVEVIIEKIRGGGGTARTTDLSRKEDKYKVTFRVTYKAKVYEYSSIVGSWRANVYAKLLGVELLTPPEPTVTMESVNVVNPEEITVKVTKNERSKD